MRRVAGVAGVVVLVLCACRDQRSSPSDRGAGLETAELTAEQRASAYAVAINGAFTLQPALVLLLNPAVLPRRRDAAPSDTLSPEVVRRLQARGVIQGTCTATAPSPRSAPICQARAAGYEIQFSDIFRIARDTIQLYLRAERYRASRDTLSYQPPLEFEQRYTLARSPEGWVEARKERLSR